MRQFFLSATKLIFLSVGISIYCQAQTAKSNPVSAEPEGKIKNVKLYRNQVNSKAVRDFMKRYKDVSNEKWTITDAGITASFVNGEIGHSVCYDEKGNWLFTVRRFSEKHLPKKILSVIRKKYFDYNINGVEETEKPFKPLVYQVLLENETGWIKLRGVEGELSELERVHK